MDFLSFGLNQEATYWELLGVNGYNEPEFALPVKVDCRWENRINKIQNDEGVEVVSNATVFLDQVVKVGDYLALGDIAEDNPHDAVDAHRVLGYGEVPSLDGLSSEKKAFL